MWLARNLDNSFRLFQMIPRRFHSGPSLKSENVGFNDSVHVQNGEDIYSFWAEQRYYQSNQLCEDSLGLSFYTAKGDEHVYIPYEPKGFENMTWEDDPVEVEIINPQKLYKRMSEIVTHYCDFAHPTEECMEKMLKEEKID